MTAPKVGDVVAWADVPDGALVRQGIYDGRAPQFHYHRRHNGHGTICGLTVPLDDFIKFYDEDADCRWERMFGTGGLAEAPRVTVVALGLTGQETAADLQRLAEVFDVFEALREWRPDTHADWCAGLPCGWPPPADSLAGRGPTKDSARMVGAVRLHALGWRKGMTAEDAARLLREADR